MDENRDLKVVLKEAELLASSPETVANWLRDHNRWSATDPADDCLEANLLARKHRLIDLALARYGQCDEVLRTLFSRDDEILRTATLSNENVYRSSSYQIAPFLDPHHEHGDDGLSWVSALSELELKALFSNPALPPFPIREFFEMKGVWQVLSEGQRKSAAWCISRNMMQWADRFSVWDASTWEGRRLDAVRAAWELADKIEMTPPWPALLGRLYAELDCPRFVKTDPLQMAARWTDPDDQEKSKEENAQGYLTTFQEVRCGLGRLAAANDGYGKEVLSAIIAHDDIAIRCAAYLVGNLSAEQVKAACEKDELLACSYLIKNEDVWKRYETRDLLEEACEKFSKGQDWVVSLSYHFHRQRGIMSKAYPGWFKQNAWSDDEADKKLVTASSIGELVERVTSSEAFIVMGKSIERMQATASKRFWVLIAILAVIAFKMYG